MCAKARRRGKKKIALQIPSVNGGVTLLLLRLLRVLDLVRVAMSKQKINATSQHSGDPFSHYLRSRRGLGYTITESEKRSLQNPTTVCKTDTTTCKTCDSMLFECWFEYEIEVDKKMIKKKIFPVKERCLYC